MEVEGLVGLALVAICADKSCLDAVPILLLFMFIFDEHCELGDRLDQEDYHGGSNEPSMDLWFEWSYSSSWFHVCWQFVSVTSLCVFVSDLGVATYKSIFFFLTMVCLLSVLAP